MKFYILHIFTYKLRVQQTLVRLLGCYFDGVEELITVCNSVFWNLIWYQCAFLTENWLASQILLG